MSGVKRFLMLLIIVGGIAVMGLAVIASLMIFIPDLTMFGVTYVSAENYKEQSVSIVENDSFKYPNINIETKNADVCIMGANVAVDNTIFIKIKYNISGFANTELLEPSFTVEQDLQNENINITTLEPTGVIFKVKTIIYIHLPSTKLFKNINITSQEGQILLGDAESPTISHVKNLSVNQSARLNGVKYCNRLDIVTSLNLNTQFGKFIASGTLGKSSTPITININSKLTAFEFNDVFGNIFVSQESNSPAIYLNQLNGNLEYYATQGYIHADIINGQTTIDTTGGDFNFGELKNSIGVIGDDASVQINKLNIDNLDASFTTGNGQIKINEVIAKKVSIYTEKGAIKVSNANCKLDIATNYGSVDVEYDEDYSASGSDVVKIVSNNGKIMAKNLKTGVYLECQNRGQIEAAFLDVCGSNIIKGTSNVTLILPLAQHILRTETNNGEIDVAMGLSCKTTNWDNAWYNNGGVKKQDFNVNSYIENYTPSMFDSAINKLRVITTNGKIIAKTPLASLNN